MTALSKLVQVLSQLCFSISETRKDTTDSISSIIDGHFKYVQSLKGYFSLYSAYNGKRFLEQKKLQCVYKNRAIEDCAQAESPHRDTCPYSSLDQLPETSPLSLSRPACAPSTSPPARSSSPASNVSALSPPSSTTASSPPSSVQSAAPSPFSMASPEQTVQSCNTPSETESTHILSPPIDYSSGQSVVSPPSVGVNTQVSSSAWPVKSPPSVQSPDSGIGMRGSMSSPPSVFTLSPLNGSMANGGQEIYYENVTNFGVSTTHAPNSIPAQNSTHSSISGFHPGSFQFATLPQSSSPHTFQQPQHPMFSQVLPSQPLAAMPSSVTGSSTTDPVLTQLLQEAVALNNFSNTGFLAATNTQNEFRGIAPSAAQNGHDLASQTAIVTSGTVSVLPASAAPKTQASLQNSEVEEILQQFLP